MTDEIIKGLENVRYHLPASSHKAAIDVAIDYINEQQAEIDRLKELINRGKDLQNRMVTQLERMEQYCENARAEAIKDFAEKLKEKAKPFLAADILGTDDVDELVKEMVGADNE